jgi:hypothetical protein
MKNSILIHVLLLISNFSIAQEFKVDLSYHYLYAKQWDEAIQTYNFNRPFLTEKQPVLMHGINTSISYIFKNDKKIKHGVNLSYAYFRSSAENENFDNTFNLHFANLGYILHYENQNTFKGLYTDLILSASSSLISRNVNGEPFGYDETLSKGFGIGGNLLLKLGYSFHLKNKSYLSPFIALAYTPYFYSPNHEAVINQTKGLTSKNWTGIVAAQIGLSYHMRHENAQLIVSHPTH